MAKVTVESRYKLTPTKVDDAVAVGKLRFEIWKQPEIDMTTASIYVVVESDLQRMDNIAYTTLGDPRLFWAICLVNNIRNPLTCITPGMSLKIPTLEAILESLAVLE